MITNLIQYKKIRDTLVDDLMLKWNFKRGDDYYSWIRLLGHGSSMFLLQHLDEIWKITKS